MISSWLTSSCRSNSFRVQMAISLSVCFITASGGCTSGVIPSRTRCIVYCLCKEPE
jgi:hypothetical protein